MERRTFLGVISGGLLAGPLAAEAQAVKSVPVVGVLNSGVARSTSVEALRRNLRQMGYVEGQTIALEVRFAGGRSEPLPALAVELTRRKVDVLVAIGPAALKAASVATSDIPIVTIDLESDPVQSGFVRTFARPGGNVTGLFLDLPSLTGKWLELINEVAPPIRRIAVVWDTAAGPWQLAAPKGRRPEDRHGSPGLGNDRPQRSQQGTRGGGKGRIVKESEARVAKFAVKHRLPTTSMFRSFAMAGGLLAYGPHRQEYDQGLASYVDRILKGAKPGDLPVEQPIKFELVINLKTAKALGLTIPPALLQRADQVIE